MKTDYADIDDHELFELFHRRGQERAFEELMSRHSAPLMRYIGGMLGVDSGPVDDVFQETWIRVIKNGDKWHGGSFRAWLMTIAHNATVDMLRRLKPTVSLDMENESGEAMGDSIPAKLEAPDMVLEGSEAERYITDKVLELPPAQREVFLMRVMDDMSFKEISEALKIPLNTALGRMHYAVTKLRTELTVNRAEWKRNYE